MNWDSLFSLLNGWALVGWAALILAPRRPAVLSAILYLGVALLCLAYPVMFAIAVGGGGTSGDFGSIAGIRALFASDAGIVIGWTHYLAFDLFVGLWIARDADAKRISRWVQAPILLATLLAGPIGLLIWLIIREPAARRQARG